jgi:hypothetical protein
MAAATKNWCEMRSRSSMTSAAVGACFSGQLASFLGYMVAAQCSGARHRVSWAQAAMYSCGDDGMST